MYCKRCGHALPSEGYICKNCGAMMSKEQINAQKKYMYEQKKNPNNVSLLSERYNGNVKRDLEKRKESKFLGVILIILVVILLVILFLP